MPDLFGGSSSSSSGGGVEYIPPAGSSGGSKPFIDWGTGLDSLASIATAGPRAVLAGTRGLGDLAVQAGKSIAGAVSGFTKETVGGALKTSEDLLHGNFSDLAPSQVAADVMPGGVGHPDLSPASVTQYSLEHPFTGSQIASNIRFGQDIEQVARAGGNTLLPGQPFGSNVGQLGSGAGLLGHTAAAAAVQRGGGGILPKLIEDAANASAIIGPVSEFASAAADTAAEEAAARATEATQATKAASTATKAATQGVTDAASRLADAQKQLEATRAAASAGDPAAAAQYLQHQQEAAGAAESLREAQQTAEQVQGEHGARVSAAQQAAQDAQQRADQLSQRAKTVKIVKNLGSKAANSPFGVPKALADRLLPRALNTALGQAAAHGAEPLIGRVSDMASKLASHVPEAMTAQGRAESRQTRAITEEGSLKQQNEQAIFNRGLEQTAAPTNVVGETRRTLRHPIVGVTGMSADPDAQAIATMAQTGEGPYLKQQLLDNATHGIPVEETLKAFDESTRHQYTPEQLQLAGEVYGTGELTGRAAEIAKSIPQVREAYTAPEAVQTENYRQLRGETQAVRGGASDAAFAHAEWNIAGTEAKVGHLPAWQEAVAAADRARPAATRAVERSGKAVAAATAKVEATGLSAEERANPKALLSRVMVPATAVAHDAVADERIVGQLAQATEPRLRTIGNMLATGKLAPALGERDLAGEILRLSAVKNFDSLSGVAQELVSKAAEQGMGVVPRQLAHVGRVGVAAERVGAGAERLKIGSREYDRAVSTIASGQRTYGDAMDKLRRANKPPSRGQFSASARLMKAVGKLADLRGKVQNATSLSANEHADLLSTVENTPKQVIDDVRAVRSAVKESYAADAAALKDELDRADITTVKLPPMKSEKRWSKKAGRTVTVRVRDWNNPEYIAAGGEALRHAPPSVLRDPRFFREDGKTPNQIAEAWASAHGVSGQNRGAGDEYSMGQWLDAVTKIKQSEDAARRSVDTGWTAKQYGDASGLVASALEAHGFERNFAQQIAGTFAEGHPRDVAAALTDRINEEARSRLGGGEPRTAPEGDVGRALASDQELDTHGNFNQPGRASLDTQGQALYDRMVANAQLGTQEKIVGQREAQLGRTATPARVQGQQEGALLGKASERMAQGEAAAGRADRQVQSGRALVGNAAEATRQTAEKLGPAMQMYAKVGSAERGALSATADYEKQVRALDKIDERLATQHARLIQSVAASPRTYRPILELARRTNAYWSGEADKADAEFGPGAGDPYRVVAAEATLTFDQLRRAGIDPQFLIGSLETEPPTSINPSVDRQRLNVAATGQRKAGVGLAHPTSYAEMAKRGGQRITQIVKNETAQDVINAVGGSLRDMLARRLPGATPESIEKLAEDPAALAAAMQDAHLSAWDVSSRRGGLKPGSSITLDTPVVPTHIWRTYIASTGDDFRGGKILATYDRELRHWKSAQLYLTGRWHSTLLLGHAVMAMAGAGLDPVSYFHDLQNAVHLDRLRKGIGTEEDRAFLEQHLTDAQQRGLQTAGGFTPGSVVNRGYSREEFGSGQLQKDQHGILHPVQGGWRAQSYLDNVNRTAVWLGLLEKGLDRNGLADFRNAYPNMAHLSDDEIRNEAAIRLSIRAIGDYTNLTSVERNVVKRVIPFYPWLRHITKLSLDLAVHHPVRTAWMLHLPLMFSPQTSQVDWLGSSYQLGGPQSDRWYTPPNSNPFATLAQLTDPNNPFGAVSPLLSTPAGLLTGYDLKKFHEITRAPGTPPGGLGLSKMGGYFAGSQLAPFAALREALPSLAGHEPIARFQTGQPVLVGGAQIPADQYQVPFTNANLPNSIGPLTPLIGLGYQRHIDAAQVLANQEKKAALLNRQAQRYEQQRAAAAAGG